MELTTGVTVKDTKQNDVIGVLDKIEGTTATIKMYRRFGDPVIKEAQLEDLIEVCSKYVSDGMFSGHLCGRPVKDNRHMCGIHLGALKRQETNRAKWQAEAEEARKRRDESQRARADMADTLKDQGLYDRVVSFDGDNETVTLKLDTLLDIIRNA